MKSCALHGLAAVAVPLLSRPIEYLRVGEPVERVFERRGDACVEASAVERHWRLEPVELAGLRRVVDTAP